MITSPIYKVIIWITTKIRSYIIPSDYTFEDGISYWRDRILSFALLFGLSFGSIVFFQSIIYALKFEYWGLLIVDSLVYVCLAILVFRRSLPYSIRSYSAVLIVFFIGIAIIFSLGPLNSGALWLFFLPIICALLIGEKSALLAILMTILVSIAVGISIHFNFLGWGLGFENPVMTWIGSAILLIKNATRSLRSGR